MKYLLVVHLDPTIGNYGCVVPQGACYTITPLNVSCMLNVPVEEMEKVMRCAQC